jgi:hypothetical protein
MEPLADFHSEIVERRAQRKRTDEFLRAQMRELAEHRLDLFLRVVKEHVEAAHEIVRFLLAGERADVADHEIRRGARARLVLMYLAKWIIGTDTSKASRARYDEDRSRCTRGSPRSRADGRRE